jgi:hypothetical protein
MRRYSRPAGAVRLGSLVAAQVCDRTTQLRLRISELATTLVNSARWA